MYRPINRNGRLLKWLLFDYIISYFCKCFAAFSPSVSARQHTISCDKVWLLYLFLSRLPRYDGNRLGDMLSINVLMTVWRTYIYYKNIFAVQCWRQRLWRLLLLLLLLFSQIEILKYTRASIERWDVSWTSIRNLLSIQYYVHIPYSNYQPTPHGTQILLLSAQKKPFW